MVKFKQDIHTGCIVPTNRKLNQDGYYRARISGKLMMYHRYIWEFMNHKKIPEGFEINHLCKNRACSNIDHLDCIDGSLHAILTNQDRYKERKEAAEKYWNEFKPTGTYLARLFDVSFSAACGWIRGWKLDETH